MIKIPNPYEVLLADTEKSEADIVSGYGRSGYAALRGAQELQAAAFRQGARAQLDAACADLRTWAVAYQARADALSSGAEKIEGVSSVAATIGSEYVSKELAQFAKDWASDEYGVTALSQGEVR